MFASVNQFKKAGGGDYLISLEVAIEDTMLDSKGGDFMRLMDLSDEKYAAKIDRKDEYYLAQAVYDWRVYGNPDTLEYWLDDNVKPTAFDEFVDYMDSHLSGDPLK